MKKFNKDYNLLLGLVFIISFGLTYAWLFKSPKERYVETVDRVLPATVSIICDVHVTREGEVKHGRIGGAGVFISPNGRVLTCAHLFNTFPVDRIFVRQNDGGVMVATLLKISDTQDLALIKIGDHNTPYVKLADPRSLRVGQEVIAVGSPMGLDGTVTTGVISILNSDVVNYDMIQMSAPINPGNSGGPLFNLNGQLIGINVAFIPVIDILPIWSGLGFSVSATEIYKFLVDYKHVYEQ